MDGTTREWARIAPHEMLIATASQASVAPLDWHQGLGVMLGRGSVATTAKLLDGAVGAAFAAPAATTPQLTLTRWAFRLAGMYHLTHSTAPLMDEAARRFGAVGRRELATWAEDKAHEEHAHDRLALKDLTALGYHAEALVRELVPTTAARLLAFFTGTVKALDPIGCVGYSYALERLATTVGEDDIRRVEALLPAGTRATRCLRVHSAVGGDALHARETVDLVARLSGPERTQVAVACHRAARLCFEAPPEGHPTDQAIESVLCRHRL
ncbi:MAG: hypothetical protein ABJE95_01570 [Byssovorax sp.]